MTTKMNKNGVSTCKAGENYEKFQMTIGRKDARSTTMITGTRQTTGFFLA